MVEPNSPDFSVIFEYQKFSKPLKHKREFNRRLDTNKLYKFFPVDDEESYPE